jgi:hypothetical protein
VAAEAFNLLIGTGGPHFVWHACHERMAEVMSLGARYAEAGFPCGIIHGDPEDYICKCKFCFWGGIRACDHLARFEGRRTEWWDYLEYHWQSRN